jgi:alkylation response protein AidB-like acyl-CoA dehydrogenase
MRGFGLNKTMEFSMSNDKKPMGDGNLTEDILRQGGATEDEVKRTGTIDRADDDVEAALPPAYRTENSPVHKAFWQKESATRFGTLPPSAEKPHGDAALATLNKAIAIATKHHEAGTIYGEDNRVPENVLADLGPTGYWGLRGPVEFGGKAVSDVEFMRILTEMTAKGDPSVAGLASVHQCIGAVDPIMTFGNDEQKAEFLPRLLSGQKLSCFMLTEPNAGSDLTAVRTSATEDGDDYLINGEKLFITNLREGRIASVVARTADGKLNVFVCELPEEQNDAFRLKPYGIWAVPHCWNQGVQFTNFRVPKKNLIKVENPATGEWESGKGLHIAYHGLNRGRVAIAALAGGLNRRILASMMPWGEFRHTYGKKINDRKVVQRRYTRAAALIQLDDALRDWCSSLLDNGYRGELECVVAKVLGSESTKEMAIELGLRTHGGRSFRKGHIIGDNFAEFFASLIYEGENEILLLSFVKSLLKYMGEKYMGAMMGKLAKQGINMAKLQKFEGKELAKLLKPGSLAAVAAHAPSIAAWAAGNELKRNGLTDTDQVHPSLQHHIDFVSRKLAEVSRSTYRMMIQYGVKLADHQDLMIDEIGMPAVKLISMLVMCSHAATKGDQLSLMLADIYCADVRREMGWSIGKSKAYRKKVTKAAELILAGKFTAVEGVPAPGIIAKYENIADAKGMH